MKITISQKEQIKKIARKYHLKIVLLFGSQISGKQNKESDVDIAILPEKKLKFNDEIKVDYELTKIFKEPKVEIINLKTAPPLLMKEIVDNNQILYKNAPDVYDRFELYALNRYQEARPLYKIHQEAIKQFIGSI